MNLTWLYVAVIYALAVWLARRGGADLPWRVAFFFYAVVLVFFWPVLAQDYVNFSIDSLKELPPWAYLRREWRVINGELNDLPFQLVPWAHQVRESWKSFELPLWNHLAGSGYPLLANGQSSAFSIIRILALPLSLGHAMSAEVAMKLLVAMTFTYRYCRGRAYSMLASAIGGVSFGLSGFLIAWLHFPHVTVACMAPAVLYCIDRLAERRTLGRFAFAAVIGMIIVFGGHPETAAHLFLLATGYVLWILIVERPADFDRKRFMITLAAAVVVAALLAAPYLATLAESVPRSMRVYELGKKPLPGVVGYGDWKSALLLLQPHFFGQAPLEVPWGPAQTEGVSGYVGVLGAAAWVALLVNAIVTRRWRTREMFYLLASIACLGVILNWPGFRHVIHAILPMVAHSRLRLELVLMLSILIAAAIDKWGTGTPFLLGLAAVSITLFLALHTVDFPARFWRDTAVLAMLPSLAVLALAALAVLTKRRAFLVLLLAAVVVELSMFGRDRNPLYPASFVYPRTPLIDALDALHAKQPANDPMRIAATGSVLYPNTHAIFGYEDIRVHDPMAYRKYVDFLELTAGFESKDRYHPWWEPWFDPTALDFLNVRYVVTYNDSRPRNLERLSLLYNGIDGRIFENKSVLPRFYAVRNVIIDFNDETFRRRLRHMDDWAHTAILDELKLENQQQHDDFFHPRPADSPMAEAQIISATPTDYRLRVSAPRYSLVVSSIPWWPGWKVTRNGERADPIRMNGAFFGFAVPKGEWDVRVWYAPSSFRLGAALSLLTAAALIIIAVRRRSA